MSDEEESFVILATSMDSLTQECIDESQGNDNSKDQIIRKIIKLSVNENSAVEEDDGKEKNAINQVNQETSNSHLELLSEDKIKQTACLKEQIEKFGHTDFSTDSSALTQYSKSVKLWQKPSVSSAGDAELSSSFEKLNNVKTNEIPDNNNLPHKVNSMTKTQIDDWIDVKSLQSQQQSQTQQEESLKIVMDEKSNANSISNTVNQNVPEQTPAVMNNVGSPFQSGVDSNLAASFIMGEIDADALKSSICTQFPSISTHASAEDVATLQSFFIDHIQLQRKFTKFTNTVRLYHKNALQWKDNLKNVELQYKEKIQECEDQMKQLHIENESLKQNIEAQKEQMKAVEIAQQRDRLEMIQVISEKSAIVENMRTQIEKLEQDQLASYSLMPKQAYVNTSEIFEKYMTREEHVNAIKPLKEKISKLEENISELLAQNLDFKNLEKHYMDEITNLKVKLTANEELLRKSRDDIAQLRVMNLAKQQQFDEIQAENSCLIQQTKQNCEQIILLEKQNQIHQRDFELEKKSCEFVTEEKGNLLKNLRKLHKRNQQLIDERKKWLNEQLTLPKERTEQPQHQEAQSSNIQTFEHNQSNYCCPICNRNFTALHDLQVHVNPCIDKLM